MNRRGFLSTMLAACAAPAVCKAEWLMKGRVLVRPGFTTAEAVRVINIYPELPPYIHPLVEGEISHSAALQLLIDESARTGQRVKIPEATYNIDRTIFVPDGANIDGTSMSFNFYPSTDPLKGQYAFLINPGAKFQL